MLGIFRPIIEKNIGSGLRLLLNVLGGWLINQGIANAAQWEQFVLAATPILAAAAWTIYDNWRTRIKIEVAKELPAGATDKQVKAVIKKSDTAENISRALTVH